MGLYSKHKGASVDLSSPALETPASTQTFTNDLEKHLVYDIVVSGNCKVDMVKDDFLFGDNATVKLDGTTLTITGASSNTMNFSSNNGNIVISGSNISIINGVVQMDTPGGSIGSTDEIEGAVKELSLDDYDMQIKRIKLSGQSSLSSLDQKRFQKLQSVRLSGQSRLHLNDIVTRDTYFRASGQSTISLLNTTHDSIEIEASGQSKVIGRRIHSRTIDKQVSGQSQVELRAD